MDLPTLFARGFLAWDGAVRKVLRLAEAIHVGIWLGLLDRERSDRITEVYYSSQTRFNRESYNLQGLFGWEQQLIDVHFADCRKLLIVGAGGGREVIALSHLGFEVEASDCNSALVSSCRNLLEQEGLAARVECTAPDECLEPLNGTDGVVVGWGVYFNIWPRALRVTFLRRIRDQLTPGAPLLLSFSVRSSTGKYFQVVYRIARLLRRLRGAEAPELGDHLSTVLEHAFTREELEGELREAGFRMTYYGDNDAMTAAVGIAGDAP